VDLEDFKSFCRVLKTSGVGSIPTHSRHTFQGARDFASPGIAAVTLALSLSLFASPSAASSSAAVWAIGDTTGVARADSAAVPGKEPVWTMQELKSILGGETAGLKGGQYKERKSGRVAMVCALLCPGLGQMYNEKPFKAALAAGVEWYYLNQILLNRRYSARERRLRDMFPSAPRPSSQWLFHDSWATEYRERSVDWTWWSGAVVLAILIDAYVDAHLDDMHFKVKAGAEQSRLEVGLVFPY
jgi:hypothetical protein